VPIIPPVIMVSELNQIISEFEKWGGNRNSCCMTQLKPQKTRKTVKLEGFIRDDVYKISGECLPEEFFEDKTIGRIWHFLTE
jgi:hypothetical protein